MKADCTNCMNSNCIIKRNYHCEGGKEFIAKKHTLHCKKNQNFIIEGSPVHGLYFIYKGKAKIAKTGIHGREQIVRFAKDGETIGHRGFGSGQFYQISAVAMEDTILCNFGNEVLNEMLLKIPTLTYDFMLFYAEELNRSETKVKKFAQMTVREKVIDALLYMYRKFGLLNGFLNVQLSRKEIADFAGTTDEQVIRVLSSLKKEALIHTKGKKIGLANPEALRKEIAVHNYFLDS
ncbi:Crp/Fnr family transcriptional regulator [Reichenbachiella sp. MALMAid0571]|uniref:Crp/Fnr family transcriptional regulator n=1 Tax=Reichenbachiella sp. MALMAid0571 TaxID=3143939 RepID=UPI0032DEB1EB